MLEHRLPPGFDIDTHFSPRYEPWDQRMCVAPDGDLFDAIRAGGVSVVTDRIATFTETGLALASGAALEADLIVTATGLNMVPLGGIRLSVDEDGVELSRALTYRGMQLSGVPNLAFAFGYANQSWTLGSDLTCERVCRLLTHMDRCGYAACTPRNRDPAITADPSRRSRRATCCGRPAGSLRKARRTPGAGSSTTCAPGGRCAAPRSTSRRSSSRGSDRRNARCHGEGRGGARHVL